MTPRRLEQIAGRWRWQLGARDALFALGAAGIVAAVTLAWASAWPWLAAAAFLATLVTQLTFSRPWTLDAAQIVRHLDRAYPDLEESSALWLRPPERLTLLERLQLKRIDTALNWVIPDDPPPGEPPRGFLRTAVWCASGGLMVWAVVGAWSHAHAINFTGKGPAASTRDAALAHAVPAAPGWPRIVGGGLTVTPPAYTGRPARRVDGFNAEVEEGANVTWTFGLDRPVRGARLVFDTDLPLRPFGEKGLGLTAARVVNDPELYHLAAILPDGRAWNPPGLYSLKVIKDRAPTVRVLQPVEPRTIIEPSTPAPRVTVEVLAGDDYGISEAHLVATVAKGSGESVKFREQVLPFDTDAPADADAPHGRRFTRTLDLGALGMEGGDELYFFVEAHDNRQPAANRTRSETRFLTLRGPEQKTSTAGRGVAGINLVPVYFRSERQIIIDTEKLIADHPDIPDAEYRRRANDLGLDQQILRLRYGQFLGEELENGNASADHVEVNLNPLQAVPPEGTGPHAAASVAQRFLQEHAEQDRGENPDTHAGPRAAPEKGLTADEVRKPFVDSHGTQDAATLFDRETKGTLKDVIAAMWEAEGCLRTIRVPDALAPEHRALEILKNLQQSARAYVQHVGFEPAPLKIDERRLKGDATGAPALASDKDALPPADPSSGAVRAALSTVPWTAPPAVWPPEILDALRQVEPVLTAAATRQPEMFLDGLQTLRRVRAGDAVAGADALRPLERALWRLLPASNELPVRGSEPAPTMADAYAKALRDAEAKR